MNDKFPLVTVAEFWELPDPLDTRLELVNGIIIDRPPYGARTSLIVGNILWAVDDHVRATGSGLVFMSGVGYALSEDPPMVRMADVSFVAEHRIPEPGLPEGFWPGPPDLAVMVVSRDDRATALRAKIGHFLTAGTRLVWVFWPDDRSVTVHRPDAPPIELRAADTLGVDDVLPGFSVQISPLFEITL